MTAYTRETPCEVVPGTQWLLLLLIYTSIRPRNLSPIPGPTSLAQHLENLERTTGEPSRDKMRIVKGAIPAGITLNALLGFREASVSSESDGLRQGCREDHLRQDVPSLHAVMGGIMGGIMEPLLFPVPCPWRKIPNGGC